MRKALPIAVAVLVVLGAAATLGFVHLRGEALSAGPATQDQKVTVLPGSSLRTVLSQLHDLGLVAHPRLLELYLRYANPATRGALPAVHKGRYLIPVGLKPLDILEQLEQGRVILEQFTIVEGWTFTQIRQALARLPVVTHTLDGRDDAAVMTALDHEGQYPEGRFAPDTYRFAEETSDREILQLAYAAQQRILAKAWESRIPNLPVTTPDEVLVLASIIEKETGLAKERPLIAGVFVNRLRQGMRLQSDPTVIYGIRDRYDGDIRTRDLRTDTPYNTYTRSGLPPTPIAMPGSEAIWAATHPDRTDAVFFVALGDGTGGHHFSATLAEHNQAVRGYLERLKRSDAAP
jgi:UPF0755 protein